MKSALIKTLKTLGVMGHARKYAKHYHDYKYKDTNKWYLNHRDISLVYNTSDLYSRRWFLPRYSNGKIHEPIATNVFIDHINSDSVVLDIGGHLGYFSCVAGSLAKNGSVHVFEVDPKCLGLIAGNLQLNNLDNVQIHNYAVSNSNGTIKIPEFETPNPCLTINSISASSHIEVPSITIDSFIAQHKISPDFIKIDIEGAEWNALEGMKHTLANENATILVEIHVDILLEQFNVQYNKIVQLLIDHDYILKEIEHRRENGSSNIVDMNTQLEGNTMILCTKKSN